MSNQVAMKLDGREAGLPLGEAVFRSLRRALRAGIYRPGDRLREQEVAERLQVSRTPVREALGRLAMQGLVESAGGRGMIVRSLSTAEVLELYAMRELLEGAAARLAAQHASRPEVDALTEMECEFEQHSREPAEMAKLNLMLHEAVTRAARNRYLDGALQELQDAIALLGVTTFSVTGRPSSAAKEHRAIIAAIAERDPDKAEQAARAHIREALRFRLKLLRE
jgi:DNA-binding GntR family transcriptional regulator